MDNLIETRGSLLARNTAPNLIEYVIPMLVGVITIPSYVVKIDVEGFEPRVLWGRCSLAMALQASP
jgi:hypothetical protein